MGNGEVDFSFFNGDTTQIPLITFLQLPILHCVGQTDIHTRPGEVRHHGLMCLFFFFFLNVVVSICKADLMHGLTALNL